MNTNSVSDKTHLIKMDMAVQDIYRIWKETPSDYIHGKTLLSEARGLTRSNLKKAHALAEKARKSFAEESALAVRFNAIKDRLDRRNGNVMSLISEYRRHLSNGEMKDAGTVLDKLVNMRSSTESSRIVLEKVSGGDATTVLSIKNDRNHMITVESISAYNGNGKVQMTPAAPFPVYSNSSKDIVIESGENTLTVKARIRGSSGVTELEYRGGM